MKIGLLTSQAFSANTLHHLARGQDAVTVIGIPPDMAARAQVAGYMDFAPLCAELGVPYHPLSRYDFGAPEDQAMLAGLGLDVLLTLGWNRLLPEPVLDLPRLGVIGSHTSPAALPFGRGRAPVVWSIVLGMAQVTCQLLKLDRGTDTGAVLARRSVPVGPDDTTRIMYCKIAAAQTAMIPEAIARLAEGSALPPSGLPELELPKRGPEDANIRWADPAPSIHNLVRAVSRPFHGAFFTAGDAPQVLWQTRLWDTELPPGAPGEVAALFDAGVALVRAGQGGLLLLEHSHASIRLGERLRDGSGPPE